MTEDRTEQLIRDAFADQAARAADGRDVLEALRGGPKGRYGVALATVAVVVVAVAAFVVPEVFRRSAPTPPVAEQPATVAPTSVLVVGTDENRNTDTIVLVRTAADGSVSLVSIPRDTWADQPGAGKVRLNQVLPKDGVRPLADTVTALTGVTLDHVAIVDMSALGAVADAVGGVPVCLRTAVEDRYSGADFPKGEQVVTGADALAFVRQRHGLPNGDLDRIARHQAFLRGLSARLPNADLPALLDAVRGKVETDDGFDLLGFVETLARATELRVGTIPVERTDVQTPQGAVIEVDPEQVKKFVGDVQGTPPASGVPCVN
ncbi:LCP family protein [Actinophytocola sp. NPDC049390]|uniref:LCP family protein n=1 Tax=Actinophytocola sp. NPDC049390 TaxID=3363894 RepID=UPI0037AE8C17